MPQNVSDMKQIAINHKKKKNTSFGSDDFQNCADNQDIASESYSKPTVNPKIQVFQCRCLVEAGGLLYF